MRPLLLLFIFLITCAFYPLSTESEKAKQQFNDALYNFYAYTFDASSIAFKQAAESDPGFAMAYWGEAMAKSAKMKTEEEKREVATLVSKAKSLSGPISEKERDFIEALEKRFPAQGEENKAEYKAAMKKIYEKYPDDLDAANLYTESLEYKDPEESIRVLDSVLKRDPDNLAANHYYIHTLEDSDPLRALMSAHKFFVIKSAPPHILHMPTHIYILLGDYEKSAVANLRAISADKKYREKYGLPNKFPTHFYLFLTRTYMWQENKSKALKTALETAPHDFFTYFQALLYFHAYDEMLKMEEPKLADDKSDTAYWHAARGIAFAAKGQITEAQKERELFLEEKEKVTEENPLLGISEMLLEAEIAKANGDKKKVEKFLKEAIDMHASLYFNDPPHWYYPIRQTLGGFYLRESRFKEAEEVFRETLTELPRNGRSLFGLYTSLVGQRQEAHEVEREMKRALEHADYKINISDL